MGVLLKRLEDMRKILKDRFGKNPSKITESDCAGDDGMLMCLLLYRRLQKQESSAKEKARAKLRSNEK